MECKICNSDVKNFVALGQHIRRNHSISSKEYYDKFLLSIDEEGKCKICGKVTKFITFSKGYSITCSNSCSVKYRKILSKRKYDIDNNILESPKCYCGNLLKFNGPSKGYQKYCSVKCSKNSKETQTKFKQTCLKKYGVENPYQSEEIKEKIKETCLKKYGVEYSSKSEEVREKFKQTCLKKYGVDNPNKLEKIKEKKIQTSFKKYGVEHPSKNKEYQSKINRKLAIKKYKNKISKFTHVKPLFNMSEYLNNGGSGYYDLKYDWECQTCNRKFKDTVFSHIPTCEYCFPRDKNRSIGEKQLQEWVKSKIISVNNKYFSRDNTIYELDIFIHSIRLGIEFNGLYWHSEKHKEKKYHLNKTKWFKENFNIDIIHVFENEWLYKQNIVKSIILNKLGLTSRRIFARKCVIKKIDLQIYKLFLEENHIQGAINSKYRYGLFFENELVSVIGFGASRFKKGELELHRFCNKLNTSVIGGFSKLLKHSNFKGISFCDLRYFNGEGYKNIGFTEIGKTSPNYWYFKYKHELSNRLKFQKHKVVNILKHFDPKLTEWENMQMNGWNRIWDCGSIKLEYR